MKVKKVPLRRCLVSQQQYPKKELLRIVKTPEGLVTIDPSGKQNGRGAYIYPSEENLEKLQKTKALQRALEVPIPPQLYQEIAELLKK